MMRTLPGQPTRLDRRSRLHQYFLRRVAQVPFLPASGRYDLTISHEKKFLWYRVAKVGTRTIIRHFKGQGVHLDVDHSNLVRYAPRAYGRFFKFAMVRNPWDRLVSCWLQKVIHRNDGHMKFPGSEPEEIQQFRGFVDYVSGLDVKNCNRHLRLQCELIDLNHVDYVGRLETFDKDFGAICAVLDIDSELVVSRNVSQERRPYHEYYNDDLRDKVHRIYRKDVQVFGYEY